MEMGNCRSSCLLARPQVFNIAAYFCTATQFLYFGKLFSRSRIGFPLGRLPSRENHPLENPLRCSSFLLLFFFFCGLLGCGLLLFFGMRGAKTKLTSITQCTRGAEYSLPVFTSQTPAFPRFCRLSPAFPAWMPALSLIRFGDLGNSRSGAHSILFWVEKSAGNTLRQMLSSCWFRTLGDVVVPSVCRALINALNHINVAKCFKVSLSRSAFVCLLGFLRRTFGPVNKPA